MKTQAVPFTVKERPIFPRSAHHSREHDRRTIYIRSLLHTRVVAHLGDDSEVRDEGDVREGIAAEAVRCDAREVEGISEFRVRETLAEDR